MMKIGCATAVVGVLLIGGSFALFGLSIMHAVEARQVASVPISIGEEVTTDLINVDTSKLCQMTLLVDVRTESVQEDDFPGPPDMEPEFEARYDFPFRYTVLDLEGKTVYSSSNHIGWDSGTISTLTEDVGAAGGTVSVEHSFDKFEVSKPGRIQVRIEIEPDTTYNAESQKVMLNIYDNVSRQSPSVIGGFSMLCFAPILIVTGTILFFFGLLTRQQQPVIDPP